MDGATVDTVSIGLFFERGRSKMPGAPPHHVGLWEQISTSLKERPGSVNLRRGLQLLPLVLSCCFGPFSSEIHQYRGSRPALCAALKHTALGRIRVCITSKGSCTAPLSHSMRGLTLDAAKDLLVHTPRRPGATQLYLYSRMNVHYAPYFWKLLVLTGGMANSLHPP